MKKFYLSFVAATIFFAAQAQKDAVGLLPTYAIATNEAGPYSLFTTTSYAEATGAGHSTFVFYPFTYEAGASLGFMNCLTDIGGSKGIGGRFLKDLNLGYTHPCFGLFASASYKHLVTGRLEYTFGTISAADRVLSGVTDIAKERYNRNLNFKSRISEISAIFEVHPLDFFVDRSDGHDHTIRWSPYLLVGVGDFHFNPTTTINGRRVDLRPLHTEGEGFPEYPTRSEYKLNQVNLPLGLGVEYQYNPKVSFRAEVIYRKIFTDYLDDVSTKYIDPALFDLHLSPSQAADARAVADRQIIEKAGPNGIRGSSTERDGYFSLNLKAAIAIFDKRRG